MKILAVYLVAVSFVAVLFAQQPAANKPVPQQLKVERQNAILKLEIGSRKIQDDFSKCQQQAQTDFTKNQSDIQVQITDGIKEIGLDPAKFTVDSNTFFVVEKVPAVTPDPPAKK